MSCLDIPQENQAFSKVCAGLRVGPNATGGTQHKVLAHPGHATRQETVEMRTTGSLFETIVEASKDGIVAIDSKGLITVFRR